MTTKRLYSLPQLPYRYDALEPHISRRIMELHHGKHHAGYVDNANETLQALASARAREDYSGLAALERQLAFHLSGHILHSIFWHNLSPDGGGSPSGQLAEAIERDFGSFPSMRQEITKVAATIMGSGWAALVWEPLAERLLVTQIYDHQSNLSQSSIPLMVLDAWEHAYYAQYENRKAEYFDAVWNLWNWSDVESRFDAARALELRPLQAR